MPASNAKAAKITECRDVIKLRLKSPRTISIRPAYDASTFGYAQSGQKKLCKNGRLRLQCGDGRELSPTLSALQARCRNGPWGSCRHIQYILV